MDQTLIIWTIQLTFLSMWKLLIWWGVMPCHLVDRYQLCGTTWCLPSSRHVLPKWWRLSIKLCSTTSQKTIILIFMTVDNLKSRMISHKLQSCSDKSYYFPLLQLILTLCTGHSVTLYVWNMCSNVTHIRTHFMRVVSFGEITLVMVEHIYYMWGMRGMSSGQGQNNLASSLLNLTGNTFMSSKDMKMYQSPLYQKTQHIIPKRLEFSAVLPWELQVSSVDSYEF